MQNIKGSLNRCLHGVYTVTSPGGSDNQYCSICTPIDVVISPRTKTVLVKNETGDFKNALKNHPATQ
jgi:hypothetical protein